MTTFLDPADVVRRIHRDMERSVLRARNGVRYLSSHARPGGQTPKSVVWSRDKVKLYRYGNHHEAPGLPILIVPPAISRSYLFDLRPGDSVVTDILARGFDVFLVDWGVPDAGDARNTFETYVDRYLPDTVRAVQAAAKTDGVTVMGYCLGGVFTLLLAAAHPELGFPALITIATPVDFNEVRFLATLFRDGRLKPDDVLDADGLVPPDVCRNAFRIMKPTAEISAYANLWQQLWNDRYVGSYQAFAQWARDHVPFPGAMLRQVVHLLVEDNSLLRGTMRLGGRPVDLAGISCPVLCVIAEKDHVVPPAAAEPLVELLGPERVDILRIPGGHVSLLVGPVAAKVTLPEICDWAERHRRPT